LAEEVEQGNLRQDLYFRINVIGLAVPSLRERHEDIALLSDYMLQKISLENSLPSCSLSDSALQALEKYHFPGNVRELENILQRAATLCENHTIEESNLEFISTPHLDIAQPGAEKRQPAGDKADIAMSDEFSLEKHLEAIEIEAIEKALEETRWNKTAAAKKLGVSFRSLRYRLKKLGLD
jgi:two-component system response regulator PilR (NtrC family)